MIEVVMCTYNGQDYLLKQLESIYRQTMSVDIVNIYDDCSTDGTVELINKFILDNNLSGWKVTVNQQQLGWKRNFYNAIKKSTGDVLFFADQDDVWFDDKVEHTVAVMNKGGYLRISSGVMLIDSQGKHADYNIEESKREGNVIVSKETFKEFPLGRKQWKIGCAMAISRKLADMIRYFDNEDGTFVHDVWAEYMANLFDKGASINIPLIQHRIHESNASVYDVKFNTALEYCKVYSTEIFGFYKMLSDGVLKMQDVLPKENYDLFIKFYKWAELRQQFFSKPSLFKWLALLPYIKCYNKTKNYFGDLRNAIKG